MEVIMEGAKEETNLPVSELVTLAAIRRVTHLYTSLRVESDKPGRVIILERMGRSLSQ